MKRVALYVRVSSAEQRDHGISVDNQIDALREYAKEHRYIIAGEYNDAGISGRKRYTRRPALLQLLEDCRAGRIDLILFTKLDRWFRSVGDYYEVQRILDDCNIPWRAIWEDYETETSAGIFKVNIMLSVAQTEADRTSERIKSTIQYKLEKGEYVGGNKAPVGFMRDGKHLLRNPEEEEGTKAFFETYLATLSQQKAIEAAAGKGLKLNNVVSQRILYHPAYYGDLPYIACEPYITAEEHEIIEKNKRQARRVHKDTGYKYIFSGLLVCGCCGKKLSGQRTVYKRKKDGNETHSIRYVCASHEKGYGCTGSTISEPILENYLIEHIEEAMQEYSDKVTQEIQSGDRKRLPTLNQRLQRLKDLYELGDIDKKEYMQKRDAVKFEIAKIEKEPAKRIRKLPSDWLEFYYELDEDHKRAFWSQTLQDIVVTGMQCTTPSVNF